MTLAELGERYGDFYAPRFVLTLGGRAYEQTRGVVSDVTVDAAAEKADRFSFTVDGIYDEADGEFTGLDWGRFAMDTDVEIAMGYGSNVETLLVGTIAEQRPEFPADGGPRVTISGFGLLQEMDRTSKSRSWADATDSEVAEEVANEYRFDSVDVASTDTVHSTVVQDEESDLEFLEDLAERNSGDGGAYQVTVRRDEFTFGPAPTDEASSLTLGYGDALQSFSPEYRTGSQVGGVEYRGYDAGAKSEVVGRADHDGPGTGTKTFRGPVQSRSEAETAAQAKLDEIREERLSGRGEAIGLPEIRAGETVELAGLGERFSTEYYVESATHRVGTDGYTTSFSVRLPTEGEIG